MRLFFILLPLLLLSCLQTIDQASQDLRKSSQDSSLSLVEKKVYVGTDDKQGYAVKITALQLAERKGFGQAVALKGGKDLNDAQPLVLANIEFEFNKDSKTYKCTLKNKNLLDKMPFASANCSSHDNVVTSWTKCKKFLTKELDYVAASWYKYDENEKINLMVGEYKSLQRKRSGSGIVQASLVDLSDNGSFEAAKSYLNKWEITCEGDSDELSLLFPAKHGHEDYKKIKLDCCKEGVAILTVHIGLSEADSEELAITIILHKEDSKNVYQAFDLDDKGAIKKHFEGVVAGGDEKVILDNYKKNPTDERIRETTNQVEE